MREFPSLMEVHGIRKYKAEFMEKVDARHNQPWEDQVALELEFI